MSPPDDEEIAWVRDRKATAFASKLLIAVFAVTSAYAIVRYVVFGPIKPAHIPLYVLNKAVAWNALVVLSVALSIGPLARLWPHRFTGHLAYRKLVGLLGFVLASGHVLMSLPILTPAYYPRFFSESSQFTALAEFTMAAGIWSWLMLVLPAAVSLPAVEQAMSPEAWRRTQRWAVWALTVTLVHLLYGAPNWVRPGTWHGGLPPITLLCALTVAVVLVLRMIGRLKQVSFKSGQSCGLGSMLRALKHALRPSMRLIPALLLLLMVAPCLGSEQDWWSLRPLAKPAVPATNSPWVRTPIDAFVLAKLKENGLAPAPEADRRTLIRRLTYNLHGLPPTPQEIEAFVNDARPDAYERLVDGLLESPRYGERWGRHWLDVVHFGETHGYDKDKRRPNAWPYRDYVIRSFNQDKSYSRFVEEQLAGDVLYPDDPDGVVATGFIAAGPWDFVGHVELPETKTDGLIARSNDRDDMVATTMSTFTSVTAHCARCHDHKFDPIPQKDYYRLQAVLAGVDRADRPYDPDEEIFVQRRALTREKNSLDVRLKAISERIGEITSSELRRLDVRLDGLKREVAALPDPASSPTNGYHSAISATRDVVKWVQVDLGKSVPLDEVKVIPARPTDFPDTPGFGFPLRFRVDASEDAEFKSPAMLLDHTKMDAPSPGDSPLVVAGQSRRARFVRVTAMRLWERTNDFVFALGELQVYSGGRNVARGATVTALDSIEAGRWSKTHLIDGFNSRRRLGDGADANDPPASKWQELEKKIQTLATERQALLSSLLDRDIKVELDSVTQQLAALNTRLAALPPPKLVYAGTSQFVRQGSFVPQNTPRPIHLLNRGDVKQPGELMSPGALSCLPTLEHHFELTDPADEGPRRAALARWITDPDNVLARRSIINRVWQYHFGRGIVDTPNDFGRMGATPTHPELLDWLAVWFRENGESFKKLHKLILTSSVYRQSSRGYANFAAIDADNRFLWRMTRTRLDAESIRDAALFVAGKLDLTMGGPSVDHFFFKDDHSPVYDYTRFDVDSPAGSRRSVYRFIVRSVPDPFMECLDCADPSLLVAKRNATLTALQALAMLNNRVTVRAAEHFAERVRKLSDDPAIQIDVAFRLALGRPPRPQELDSLQAYAVQHGLANACRLILNSNEFVFVD